MNNESKISNEIVGLSFLYYLYKNEIIPKEIYLEAVMIAKKELVKNGDN